MQGIGFDNKNMTQWGGAKWDLITAKRLQDETFLECHGYKVYSQNDEDGIIQEIFRRIGTANKTFVEIGVQDGIECNTHYLLFLGWKGTWIETSEACVDAIKRKFNYVLNNGTLKVINAFVTRENINDLLTEAAIPHEVDLLSIDIDGNDLYIFEAVNSFKPRVVVIEYNGKFPPECSWCMPYCKDYMWNSTDRHGASLKALEELAETKGYVLVGTNINGVNAFFVRDDLANGLFPKPNTAENLYNPLRLGFTFKAGHPGDVCLVNPSLQMEYLFNGTNEKYITAYGFHTKEYHEDGTCHQWMSNKKAAAFLRVDEQYDGCVEIHIKYSSINYEQYGANRAELHVGAEGSSEKGGSTERIHVADLEEYGTIRIPMNAPLARDQIVKIEFEMSQLWNPAKDLGSDDNRELGISVHGIEVRGDCNSLNNNDDNPLDLIVTEVNVIHKDKIHTENENEVLLEENERLKNQIEGLLSSTSWKITRPIRFLKGMFASKFKIIQ